MDHLFLGLKRAGDFTARVPGEYAQAMAQGGKPTAYCSFCGESSSVEAMDIPSVWRIRIDAFCPEHGYFTTEVGRDPETEPID